MNVKELIKDLSRDLCIAEDALQKNKEKIIFLEDAFAGFVDGLLHHGYSLKEMKSIAQQLSGEFDKLDRGRNLLL